MIQLRSLIPFLILILLGSLTGFTQEIDSTKIAQPEIFEISQLAERSLLVNDYSKKLKAIIGDSTELKNEENYKIYEDSSKVILEIFNAEFITDLSFREIENNRRNFTDYRANLEKQLTDLTEKAKSVEVQLRLIKTTEVNWVASKKYYEVEKGEELQAALQLINENIALIEFSKKELNGYLNSLIEYVDHLNNAIRGLSETIDLLDQTIIQKEKTILSVESPPIWQILDSKIFEGIRKQAKDQLAYINISIKYFKANDRPFMYFISISFFTLIYFLYVVKRRSIAIESKIAKEKNFDPDQYLQNYLHKIFKRPISVSLLTVLLLIVTNKKVPVEIDELAVLISIVPLMIIIHTLSPKIHRWKTISIFFIYLLIGIIILILNDSEFQRVCYLGLTILLMTLSLNLLRSIKKNHGKYNAVFPTWFSFNFFRITIFLFAVSVLSNVIGAYSFSKLLLTAVFNSVHAGAVFYVMSLVISKLFSILIYSKFGQRSYILSRSTEIAQANFAKINKITFTLLWINSILIHFKIETIVYDSLLVFFDLKIAIGSMVIVPGNWIVLIVVIWLSYLLAKFVRFLLEDEILIRIKLPRGVPGTISMLTRYTIFTIGFFIAIMAAGFEMDKLAFIMGGLGVGIGFGLQDVFNNFFSGLILAFERPIQTGDTIQLGDMLGKVKEIGIRSSMVRTIDGAEVIVPNSNLVSNEVINWTLSDKYRRLEIKVGVKYGTDPEKVLEILRKVAEENDKIMKKPDPVSLFIGFGDSSLDFRLLIWTYDFENWLKVQSDINVGVNRALADADIEIPFPQRDLHIRSVDKGAGENLSGNK